MYIHIYSYANKYACKAHVLWCLINHVPLKRPFKLSCRAKKDLKTKSLFSNHWHDMWRMGPTFLVPLYIFITHLIKRFKVPLFKVYFKVKNTLQDHERIFKKAIKPFSVHQRFLYIMEIFLHKKELKSYAKFVHWRSLESKPRIWKKSMCLWKLDFLLTHYYSYHIQVIHTYKNI